MWNDLVFDTHGNLYVPDDKPRIWKVSPDGTAIDLGHRPAADRPLRLRRRPARWPDRPDRPWLYVSITVAAELPLDVARSGRIRLVDHPTAADIELVHEFPFVGDRAGTATGDRPRVREVRQPLRQPDRPEPDRRPGPVRRRDRPDLGPAVPLPVGPRLQRQVAARHQRRPRTRRQPGRLEDLQGLRRRDGPAAQPPEDVGRTWRFVEHASSGAEPLVSATRIDEAPADGRGFRRSPKLNYISCSRWCSRS